MMCLIHDLGERYMGDISATKNTDEYAKHAAEEQDIKKLLSLLPQKQAQSLLALWKEYNANETPEAQLGKALDKAETILQHNQGKNPPDFDYAFNLEYGKSYFQHHPLLQELRQMLDAETRTHI